MRISQLIQIYWEEYLSKKKGTDSEKPKAIYISQGHKDKEKAFIVHIVTTLRHSSVRNRVINFAVRKFCLLYYGVTQAYIQSDEEHSSDLLEAPKAGHEIISHY